MSKDLTNLNFLNIAYNVDNVRIYKFDGNLYCYNATRDGLEPFYTKSIYEMVTHIFNLVKDCNGTANLNFGYAKGSLSKSKTKKLAMLLKEGSQTCDFNLLSRWITLLI